jgi:hypothetical protein
VLVGLVGLVSAGYSTTSDFEAVELAGTTVTAMPQPKKGVMGALE